MADINRQAMDDEIDLIEIFKVIYKRRKLIVSIFIVTVFLSAIFSFLLPKTYKSEAVIIMDKESAGSSFSVLAQQIPFGLAKNLDSSDNVFDSIIKSKTLAKKVINELNLQEIYPKIKLRNLILTLSKSINVVKDENSESLKVISFESNKPELAYDILNAYLDAITEYNQDTKITKATRTRIFVENQLDKTKKEFDEVNKKIIDYMQQNKILGTSLTPGNANSGTAQTLTSLESQIVSMEIELKNQLKTKSEKHPDVIELRKSLEALNDKYNEALMGYPNRTSDPASDYPGKMIDFEKMVMTREIKKAVITYLSQELEKAKIDEKKKELSFTVLDPPEIPLFKSKPKRKKIIFVSAVVSLFLGVFSCFMIEFYNNDIRTHFRFSR